jgi:hypothetical protein
VPVPVPTDGAPSPTPAREAEPIDLVGTAGPAVAKRLAPILCVAVIAVIVLSRRRRRGRARGCAR